MYGGSTTSILLNTPGEIGTIVTAIDGNMMARKGRGAPGAGHGGDRLVRRRHHRHARPDLRGAADGQAGAVVRPGRVLRAHGAGPRHRHGGARRLACCAGWPASSSAWPSAWSASTCRPGRRASPWASRSCSTASNVVVVAVGLFAVGETLYVASRHQLRDGGDYALKGSMWMSAGGLGALLEALAARHRLRLSDRRPAGRRREIPTFLSYLTEKRLAKNPEEFGQGAIEGVAGPEAANNAAAAGVLAPLLTLGLPTSATAAIMLAAFQQYGLQPGPLLFESNPDAGLGHDRQPLHRQRHAAGAQPADGPGLGEAAARSRGPGSTPASSCSRRWAPTRSTTTWSTS